MSTVARSCPHLTSDLGHSMKAGQALGGELSRELPQELIVAVSAHERGSGQLSPENERAACAAFRKHGCAILRGAFPPSVIGAMYHDYVSRYGALNAREMLERSKKSP